MTDNVDNAPDEGRVRFTTRFAWSAVSPDLTRSLLVALYERSNRGAEVARLRNQSKGLLAPQAHAAFGSPPSRARLHEVADVLRSEWLPVATRDTLEDLAYLVQMGLTGPDRGVELRSKRELLAFFERRRLTETFKDNLRAAFVTAHKTRHEVPARGPGARRRNTTAILLEGSGSRDAYDAYPHQKQAWEGLDDLWERTPPSERRGLVVLPTGAGKTYTMVAWLVRRLAADPALRVLWIADQQELLDQAGKAFKAQATTMPRGTSRAMRVIHGGANRATALADPDLDVACVTRQSLLGKKFDSGARKRLTRFLERPCIVVVDEAHHVVAPTYRAALAHISESAPEAALVGLTATPWPAGYGMTATLNSLFPTRVADVELRDLVLDGVLARPVMHTFDTGETVEVSADEVKQIVGRDVPASVLRRLDRGRRNAFIVDTWLNHRERWGKTLVFACDIEHADNLGAAFAAEGIPVTVLHSQVEAHREQVLAEFRQATGVAVLVSVGMLLEGVDVPDARTAFLARPTRSRVLMRQMIGRVLRGPAGGGEEIAHVVDVRDRWAEDLDILAPVDLPGIPSVVAEEDEDTGERRLPPVLDELTSEPLGEDVLRRIERAYATMTINVPHAAAMVSTELVGFYSLDHVNIPVFRHAEDRWADLISRELGETDWDVHSALQLFEDLAVPRPTREDVREVSDFCRSHHVAPPLVPVRHKFSVRRVAQSLLDAGAMSEVDKVHRLRSSYDSTLARSAYISFQAFFEAVQQELLALTGVAGNLADPESPRVSFGENGLRRLVPRRDRDLAPIFRSTIRQARELLAAESEDYAALLAPEHLPRVDWTRKPIESTWGYWTTRMMGGRRGTPEIRINRRLQAARTQVSDELLEYLLWHELCHHLLPGRGHDAEFRRLESLWPSFLDLDHELDTLHERFDLQWSAE